MIGEEVVNRIWVRVETREDVGKRGQAKGAFVMLRWGCWDVDIGLSLLWGRDCDSGGYVGGSCN